MLLWTRARVLLDSRKTTNLRLLLGKNESASHDSLEGNRTSNRRPHRRADASKAAGLARATVASTTTWRAGPGSQTPRRSLALAPIPGARRGKALADVPSPSGVKTVRLI